MNELEHQGWGDVTLVHPMGLAALVILCILTMTLPRRYAVVPMILMACLIPSRQRIVIASIDFTFLRILVLFGFMRILSRGELRQLRWITLDRLVIALATITLVATTLRTGSASSFIRFAGVAFDQIGMYLLFRALIRSPQDVSAAITWFALTSVPVSIAFIYEYLTGFNPFSVFGGVPEFTIIRDGRLRCQGAFSHPILAGCFWVALSPLFAAKFWDPNPSQRLVGIIGIAGTLVIVAMCASSTPIGGLAVAMLGGGMFLVRKHLRRIRIAVLLLIVALHVYMKAPVWHLISRIDLAGGSTGYHRYLLIDRAIANFDEWFLLGSDSTAHWGHQMFDITNEYILVGLRGGILALGVFIAILTVCFASTGRLLALFQRRRALLILSWALGVSLFSHGIMFLAVSYFGQIIMLWALLIAMIGSLDQQVPAERARMRRLRKRRQAAQKASLKADTKDPPGAGAEPRVGDLTGC